MFGNQVSEKEIDFKWTIEDDFERLKLDKIVKLTEVRLAKSSVGTISGI